MNSFGGSRLRRAAAVVLSCALAVTVAGCTIEGSAKPIDPNAAIDVNALDSGNYKTKPPNEGLGTVKSDSQGKLWEAKRLANYVINPVQVDDSLTRFVQPTFPIRDAAALSNGFGAVFTKATGAPAFKYNMDFGFIAGRASETSTTDNKNSSSLLIGVFVFPDDAAAKGAADEFLAAHKAPDPLIDPNKVPDTKPVSLPDYPDARALYTEDNTDKKPVISVFYPKGRYVIYQWVEGRKALPDLVTTAQTTLSKELPLLDQFKPTPNDKLKDIPLDTDNMLVRTLPADEPDSHQSAVYDQRGGIHFQTNSKIAEDNFAKAGVDRVSPGAASVYRAKDDQSAQQLLGLFYDELKSAYKPIASPDGLPAVRCYKLSDTKQAYAQFWCLGSRGRYAFEVTSSQMNDVYQKAAAEIKILVNNE
ncbi:DUF7373 family lipoprotein [Antrihabitans stalactiti]|uniref:Uncharacterized protein n=1 Tax=Antrihabitans stalactiti TaxID=2584121 RepID=A0A848KQV5_9NOCA|nr:hypothetical protein [Antrihabitans stalactiti]NMN98972.1 hypothetical protein [Antrihabitans stalactiti]